MLTKVERMAERVLNGLAATEIIFPPDAAIPNFVMTPTIARQTAGNVKSILSPVEKPYDELGSVEGFFAGAERDGFGRAILFIKHRVTGDQIKCIITESALPDVSNQRLEEVFKSRRILITGRISYRGLGRVREIFADGVRFLACARGTPKPH